MCASKPQISVVMSAFNCEKYIKKAIDSILNQSFDNFEFLIIDDASSDNTGFLLSSYNDVRIKIVKNEKNIGLTKSLNKGIGMAKGKYIARMDADDISAPSRLQLQKAFLDLNEECSMVGSWYNTIDENDKIVKYVKLPTSNTDINQYLKFHNCFCHGSTLIRRDAIMKIGLYNEEYKYAQDYELWLRMAKNNKLYNLDEPLYYWRDLLNNISNEKKELQDYYAELALSKYYLENATEDLFSRPVFIWGSGNGGRKIYKVLEKMNIQAKGFIDNEPSKWGKYLNDIPIFSEEVLKQDFNSSHKPYILIGSMYMKEILPQLEALGYLVKDDIF